MTSVFSGLPTPNLRIFSQVKPVISSSCDLSPEKQILSELSAAAEQAMVATRSQNHTPRRPQSRKKNLSAAEHTASRESLRTTGKRAREQGASTDAGQAKAKRRRSSADSDLQTSPIQGQRKSAGDVARVPTSGDDKSYIPTLPQTYDPKLPNDGIEVRIPTTIHSPRGASGEPQLPAHPEQVDPGAQDSYGRWVKSESQAEIEASKDPLDSTSPQATEAPNRTPKPRHKRFDDEESLPAILPTTPVPAYVEAEQGLSSKETNGAESDDEGPETITASKGLDQARHAVEEAEKAGKRQKAEEKRKRRERDLRLKIQAKTSKKTLENSLADGAIESEMPVSPDTLVGGVHTQGQQDHLNQEPPRRAPLPLLLPDEILNAEPVIRPPTPPKNVPALTSDLSRKRKLLEIGSKPPKDVQRGDLKIRVLSSDPGYLPPKASKANKMLRESWLTGQRGPKGGIARRKLGGGFVRAR